MTGKGSLDLTEPDLDSAHNGGSGADSGAPWSYLNSARY